MQANPPVHRCRPLLEITQRPLAEVLTASGPQYLQRGSFIMFQLCSVGCTGATDFVGAQLPWRGERLHTTCAAPMQLKLMLLFKQCTDTCNCLPIPCPAQSSIHAHNRCPKQRATLGAHEKMAGSSLNSRPVMELRRLTTEDM